MAEDPLVTGQEILSCVYQVLPANDIGFGAGNIANTLAEKKSPWLIWFRAGVKKQQESSLPNYALPPGETLRETLNSLGMTRAELGKRTGLSHQVIKKIVRGDAAISTGMASELEQALGVPASFWINLEKNYRKSMDRLKGKSAFHGRRVGWRRGVEGGMKKRITILIKAEIIRHAQERTAGGGRFLDSLILDASLSTPQIGMIQMEWNKWIISK
jgi:addiction module HigA family antidote